MRFAVIGDVHSNLFALERILTDIKHRDVDFIISTGDLVGYLGFPNEVINQIREHKILAVKGNHDHMIAYGKPLSDEELSKISKDKMHQNASEIFTNKVITEENRHYLRNLPEQLRFTCSGFEILAVHGSPRAIDEYLYEDESMLRALAAEISEDVVICGHTHIPYHYAVDGKHFINAGSVGKPKHGDPKAAYAIVTIIEKEVKSEIIKVSYEVDKIVKAVEENPMLSDQLIPMLKEGY